MKLSRTNGTRNPATDRARDEKKLVNTYGKTWHTWQYDLHADLPVGVPQLMMGFTEPGQAKKPLIQQVEKEIGYSVEQRMKDRQNIDAPGANAWKQRRVYQIKA